MYSLRPAYMATPAAIARITKAASRTSTLCAGACGLRPDSRDAALHTGVVQAAEKPSGRYCPVLITIVRKQQSISN